RRRRRLRVGRLGGHRPDAVRCRPGRSVSTEPPRPARRYFLCIVVVVDMAVGSTAFLCIVVVVDMAVGSTAFLCIVVVVDMAVGSTAFLCIVVVVDMAVGAAIGFFFIVVVVLLDVFAGFDAVAAVASTATPAKARPAVTAMARDVRRSATKRPPVCWERVPFRLANKPQIRLNAAECPTVRGRVKGP